MYPELYKCPECGSGQIIHLYIEGDSVCSSCGLVLLEKQVVDSSKGLKIEAYKDSYGPGQKPWSRKQESGSIFGFSKGFRGINKNFLLPKDKVKFERLKKLHTLQGGRSIDTGLAIFRNITNEIKTPQSVKTKAATIFLESLRRKLTLGRSYESIIGAAIFIAYAINKYPKSITKLAKKISVPKEKIFKCYQLLVRELEIKVSINLRPQNFVSQFCSEVRADIVIEQRAREIIKGFQEKVNTSGKDPKGIAIGAIYLASKIEHRNNPQKHKKITQKELSSIGDVTEVTLRNRYKEIEIELSLS